MTEEHTATQAGDLSAEARAADSTVVFGFWTYLMTDFVLFASLFAVFMVLRGNTFGGVSGSQIFSLPFVLEETLILLTSSFTCGLALFAARGGSKDRVLLWLALTAALGASFVTLEVSEFSKLATQGNGWQQSGFLSSYFTLVGTHGLHVTLGLVWMVALMISVVVRGLSRSNMRKLMLLSLFWHFLDIVWIFIFTIVYLMGAV
jgi:cytochrome o ubiquinol oxidase subunit III